MVRGKTAFRYTGLVLAKHLISNKKHKYIIFCGVKLKSAHVIRKTIVFNVQHNY